MHASKGPATAISEPTAEVTPQRYEHDRTRRPATTNGNLTQGAMEAGHEIEQRTGTNPIGARVSAVPVFGRTGSGRTR